MQHHRCCPVVSLPALEQVVGRDISAVAERGEHRDAQSPSGRVTKQFRFPTAPDREQITASRPDARARGRHVQLVSAVVSQHPKEFCPTIRKPQGPDDLKQLRCPSRPDTSPPPGHDQLRALAALVLPPPPPRRQTRAPRRPRQRSSPAPERPSSSPRLQAGSQRAHESAGAVRPAPPHPDSRLR